MYSKPKSRFALRRLASGLLVCGCLLSAPAEAAETLLVAPGAPDDLTARLQGARKDWVQTPPELREDGITNTKSNARGHGGIGSQKYDTIHRGLAHAVPTALRAHSAAPTALTVSSVYLSDSP